MHVSIRVCFLHVNCAFQSVVSITLYKGIHFCFYGEFYVVMMVVQMV